MAPYFKVFPSQGYRNTQFQILKLNYGYLRVSISKDQELIQQINLDRDTSFAIFSLNEPGSFHISCEVNSVIFTETVFVNDSLRIGSSILKSTSSIYTFDGSKYHFLVFKDRTQIYDNDLNKSFTENGLSPTSINETLSKGVFLFRTNVNNSPQRLITFGMYSTKYFRFIWEYLAEAKEVYFSDELKILWLFDINSKSIKGFHLELDIDETLQPKFELKGVQTYSFFENCPDILWCSCNDSIIIINVKDFKVFNQKKNANLFVSELGFSITRESDSKIIYTNYREFSTCELNIPYEIKFPSYNAVFLGDELLSELDLVQNEIRDLFSKYLPDQSLEDKNVAVKLNQEETIAKRAVVCELFPSKSGVYFKWKEFVFDVEILHYSKDLFSGFKIQEINPKINRSTLFVNSHKTVSNEEMLPNSFTYYDQFGDFDIWAVSTSSVSTSQDLYVFHQGILLKILKNVFESTNYNNSYLILREGLNGDKYSVFTQTENFNFPFLKDIVIYNYKHIKDHNSIWFSSFGKNEFDSDQCKALDNYNFELGKFIRKIGYMFYIEKTKLHDSIFSKYIVNSDGQICSIKTGNIIDSVFGNILSISNRLHKGFVRRGESIYFFSYNFQTHKYEFFDLLIDSNFIKESYLSPKGNLLVVNKKLDEYEVVNASTGEVVTFFSGKFLEFSKEGNLVFSKKNRDLAIFDPVTFMEIPAGNYQYYRWKSPDGLLFAQISFYYKYYNKLELQYKTKEEYSRFVKMFDSEELLDFQKDLLENHLEYFKSIKMVQASNIRVDHVYEVKKIIQIGSVKFPNKLFEIELPSDLQFLNYVSFSFDNKYIGIVGKPHSNGMILIYELEFNQLDGEVVLGRRFLSYFAKLATWTCGFSRKNLFATYDSAPQTYLFSVDELFKNLESKFQPTELNRKNYLTFSPSGELFAMSEQGYDPVTLGGSGHQQSSVIHLAKTSDYKIVKSFREHGDEIKKNNANIIFVAFSENEDKLMSLSADGVVIVRNLKS